MKAVDSRYEALRFLQKGEIATVGRLAGIRDELERIFPEDERYEKPTVVIDGDTLCLLCIFQKIQTDVYPRMRKKVNAGEPLLFVDLAQLLYWERIGHAALECTKAILPDGAETFPEVMDGLDLPENAGPAFPVITNLGVLSNEDHLSAVINALVGALGEQGAYHVADYVGRGERNSLEAATALRAAIAIVANDNTHSPPGVLQ